MDFKPVVGKHVGFPNKQYKLAVWEVIDRYLVPRMSSMIKSSCSSSELDPDAAVNAGIQKGGKEYNTISVPLGNRTYETYLQTLENGQEVSRKFIAKSHYIPNDS